MRLKTTALLLFFCCVAVTRAGAQDKFDFYARGPYRSSVPRPSAITGYEPGRFQTPHGPIVRVIEKIAAAAPDRVRLIENGETWEHRKLYLAVVSAPENLARLDEIKANAARLADPRKITAEAEANQVARNTPIIVWLNYGIHGNESASYEAVQQTLYQLAASDEPHTLEILKNIVTVINVMHNPDGHERFAVWENSVAVGNPERVSLEHREPYQIYGRVNHYRFDLNRDLLAMSQPESQAFLRGVREWRPQVVIDHHGQVSNYFFPPSAEPINKNLPLDKSKFWYDKFGRGNAAAFDRHGWNYFVRHTFDVYYAGYIDSWSSLVGATGMTYETDAGGPSSLAVKLDDDTILSFRQGIAKHFTASMASLETAADNREARLKDYYQFFKTAMDEGRSGQMKRVVLLPGKDPGRTAALVRNLVFEGIEVTVAREAFRSSAARDYVGSKPAAREFPAGAYVIDFNQPQKRLAKAHLEPNPELDQSFIKNELERRARNEKRGKNVQKEGYEFYDITSWSLPLAFGVDAYWTEDAPAVKGAQVTLNTDAMLKAPLEDKTALDLSALAASDAQPLPGLGGGVEGGRANTAYVIPYGTDAAAKLTIALLAEGFKVAVTTRQMNAGGRNWPAGTLFARVHRNPESLHDRIAQLARETGAPAYAVNSAFTEEGDTGVGSGNTASLKAPRVAVVWDEASSPTGYGWMWFAFERAYGLKFTPVTIAGLKSADLSAFNVIVFPDGRGAAYQSALGKDGVDKLKGWVNNGGVLIGIGGGAAMFTRKDVELTSSKVVGADEAAPPAQPAETPSTTAAPKPPAAAGEAKPQEKPSAAAAKPEPPKDAAPEAKPAGKKKPTEPLPVPGASFRARIDRDHFLSYGYDSDGVVVLLDTDTFFRTSKDGANVVTFSADGPLTVAGFIWPDNTEELLRGTAYLIDEPTGRGHVILFADDPNYRFLWRTTTQFFLNSILLAPVLR
ncbi:MAG TPA: M14 family zinc carboxypeptidase [Blastocatellia bacterium]|nr:M14 family zinc carboxypeptidase [Blastocatellia bacterium]